MEEPIDHLKPIEDTFRWLERESIRVINLFLTAEPGPKKEEYKKELLRLKGKIDFEQRQVDKFIAGGL